MSGKQFAKHTFFINYIITHWIVSAISDKKVEKWKLTMPKLHADK